MDGNCKAGLNSSVNVNVVDRVVFRFHKVIVYHVVKARIEFWGPDGACNSAEFLI